MDLVVIKYGGGLITTKDKLCKANYEHINGLSEVVEKLDKCHVIIVHGAGSFGHLKAKEHKLHLGHDPASAKEQSIAIQEVRNDMKTLASIVEKSLQNLSLQVRVYHPHECGFEGTKYDFKCNPLQFEEMFQSHQRIISVIHGDVVETQGNEKFGILSGDDIALRLILEAEKSQKFKKLHMIFAMTGADGVMTLPPDHPESKLIPLWNPGMSNLNMSLCHNSEIDVTGGIRLKLDCASIMCQKSKANIWIVDGRKAHRIIEALNGSALGTRISMN